MDKYNSIFVDGLDKSGKNLLVKYIHNLAKHRYMAYDRGILSNVTYARMFNRQVEYNLEQYKSFVFVYLVCDEEDWKIRCKLTNEPAIDYGLHLDEFNKTFHDFENKGFKIMFLNTSHITPYDAVLKILDYVNKLNEGN